MQIGYIFANFFIILVAITLSAMSAQNASLPTRIGSFSVKEFPKLWREYCMIKNQEDSHTASLNCYVKSGRTLDIRELRSISRKVTLNLNASIQCEGGSNLFLPMPVKVPSIVSLSVDNCNLRGSNSENFDEDIAKLPDRIRYSKITNSVRIIDDSYLDIMIQSVNSHYTDSAECGPLNAEVIIERNLTVEFINSESFRILFSQNMANIARSSTIIKSICIYEKLKIYDMSQNPTLGMDPVGSLLQSSSYPVLQVMNLSRVNLNEIPHHLRKWRLYFPRMNYLDLSYNNLGEVNNVVDIGRDEVNTTIGVINLRYNKIKMLTKENLESFLQHKFVKIDVRNNPFECDCRMNVVKQFLLRNSQKLPKQYEYLYNLRCVTPRNLRGKKIINLSRIDFGCDKSSSKLEINTVVILSTLSGVIILTAVVVIVFRNEIIVLFFTRIYIHINCGTMKANDGKKYDAFIAFSEENEDWVIRTLIRRLEHPENTPTFKVCIHQRDFLLGAGIVENIMACIKQSRYFIFIISKAFLRSEWCLMEFRAALQQSLKEKTDNLIMVMLEDISDMVVDKDLQRCLETTTYVKIEDRLFWDKIVYALTRKQKKSKRQRFQVEEIEMELNARI